jgi:Ca2+-binding RTX toxin-like protein
VVDIVEGELNTFGFGYWFGEQILWNYNVSVSYGTASVNDFEFSHISGSRVGGTITLSVRALNDNQNEGDETFTLIIEGTYGYVNSVYYSYTYYQPFRIVDLYPFGREQQLMTDGRLIAEAIASNTLSAAEIAAYIDEIVSPDDARLFLKGFGDALGKLGTAFDLTVAAGHVASADNHSRAAFVEVVNFAAARAAMGLGGAAAAALLGTVGAPVVIAASGAVAALIFTNAFGDALQRAAESFWDVVIEPKGAASPAALASAHADVVAFDPSTVLFNAQWYLATYQDAYASVAAGETSSAMAHYLLYGIHKGYLPHQGASPISPDEIAMPLDVFYGDAFRNSVFEIQPGGHVGDGISADEVQLADLINAQRGPDLIVDSILTTLANRKAMDLAHNFRAEAFVRQSLSDSTWAAEWSSGDDFASGAAKLVGANNDLIMVAVAQTGISAAQALALAMTSTQNERALLSSTYTRVGVAEYGGVWIVMLASGASSGAPASVGAVGAHRVGTSGADILALGSWSGMLDGRDGNDNLTGSEHADRLFGGPGHDLLDGRGDADMMDGGAGADRMLGGLGNDLYYVDDGGDLAIEAAGQGTDRIAASVSYTLPDGSAVETLEAITLSATDALNFTGNALTNILIGNNGANILRGGGGSDLLYGLGGDDSLIGSANAGTMYGGAGNDTYYVADSSDAVIEAAGEGTDRIAASVSYALRAGSSVEILEAITQSGTDPLNFTGNAFNNTIVGNNGANVLRTGGGNDALYGLGGDDVLVGGLSASTMSGGAGNDTYYVTDSSDAVIELAGEGNDRIAASVSYVLLAGSAVELIEAVNQSATNPINLTGNAFNNVIVGNNGVNVLRTGGGNDTLYGLGGDDHLVGSSSSSIMYGGAGNDNYYVFDSADRVFEAAGEGNDRIAAEVSYTLLAGSAVETLEANTLSSTAALDFTGNALDNILVGNNGANVLRGGGGSDRLYGYGGNDVLIGGSTPSAMYGGAGNDTFYVSDGSDAVFEAVGEGIDRIAASTTYTLAASAEVEVIEAINQAANTAMNLTGSDFANTIAGNNGANVLNGRGGSDTLYGFGGADTFAFTSALGANNVDRLGDFASGTDKIALDDAVFAGLAPGTLAAAAFVAGSAAADSSDRIVYNGATGQIFYDADGNGAGAAILFATLAAGTTLTASDFLVI